MPFHCTVYLCENYMCKEAASKGITFFTFPKDPELLKTWADKCKRADKCSHVNVRICSLHFLPCDFERDLKHELLNLPLRLRLKKTAIPSQKLSWEDYAVQTRDTSSQQNLGATKHKHKTAVEYISASSQVHGNTVLQGVNDNRKKSDCHNLDVSAFEATEVNDLLPMSSVSEGNEVLFNEL